jgi:Protein of unknown function (DUF3732)
MQVEAIVLYHRDGSRRHELIFQSGRLNVVTGVSDTGKSAVLAIVDYCLGSDSHGVFKGRELETIGWYGLRLLIDNQPVFVARRRPPDGQKVSDNAMLIVGDRGAPGAEEIKQTTNIATVTAELGRMIGISENLQDPPEGSTREPVAAGLRHAVPYILQPQRLIADPKYLFDGQENSFKAQHIRDTLPYFLGAVDQDALAQRRALRTRRNELRTARAALADAEHDTSAVSARSALLLQDARANGLVADDIDVDAIDAREILRAVIEHPSSTSIALIGDAEQVASLQDQKSQLGDVLRELRAQRRALVQRARLAADFATEAGEHKARLLSLNLLPSADAIDRTCPLCGSEHANEAPAVDELRRELERVNAQTAVSLAVEPHLQAAIDDLDTQIQEQSDRVGDLDRELQVLIARNELARRARSRSEVQAYLRGRIGGFLEEHPPVDVAGRAALRAAVDLAEGRVKRLEEALSADTTRQRTENALSYVGADMTEMAQRLNLSYSTDGVQLDPVALTVVARDRNGPVWLRDDIGSGKNWVGYHIVTLLALHRYFIEQHRPVPRTLFLDQPTQAFFPSNKRDDPERGLDDLLDEDQAQVARIFDLLRDTVETLTGQLQIVVMDHAEFDEGWFVDAVGDNTWRGGHGLVPADWFSDEQSG